MHLICVGISKRFRFCKPLRRACSNKVGDATLYLKPSNASVSYGLYGLPFRSVWLSGVALDRSLAKADQRDKLQDNDSSFVVRTGFYFWADIPTGALFALFGIRTPSVSLTTWHSGRFVANHRVSTYPGLTEPWNRILGILSIWQHPFWLIDRPLANIHTILLLADF